jgi:hypothetical protein
MNTAAIANAIPSAQVRVHHLHGVHLRVDVVRWQVASSWKYSEANPTSVATITTSGRQEDGAERDVHEVQRRRVRGAAGEIQRHREHRGVDEHDRGDARGLTCGIARCA